ncbi:Bacteriophytochrome (light-regulated signal transduction histidine kinase) [Pedobacter westerhofensis]|uniref:histidine kinase n=2 Tax=Pedobacter westerhofensis TaxID=425512 RepID=A0A521FC74_9SPHI|nr:Bacteriophytochrome (light-regulated signal transduction histidine kinase) [Pedobacter westerhofensis]
MINSGNFVQQMFSADYGKYFALGIYMNLNNVDLSNCDREPIHIPGRIQSHGFLLAVDNESTLITYASENCIDFIAVELQMLLGKPFGQFEEIAGLNLKNGQLLQLIQLGGAKKDFDIINPYPIQIGNADYYMIISPTANYYLVEFEPATLEYDIQNQIGKSVSEILKGKGLRSLLQNTAKEIKDIIHYDRVMIYKFQEDGHGEVIAEVKNEDLDPFYGLHYPASDIPKQARALYKLNYTRIIADVNTISAPILTLEVEDPLDLTHSVLRAVSPIHIQYLRNMGVESSFSISLIAHGELWGLIACHNYSPKFIDYKAREGAKLIGKIVSSALEYREEEEQEQQSNIYQLAMTMISLHLGKDEEMASALTRQEYTIKDIAGASGAAVLFEDVISTVGETPDEIQLRELFVWLKATMHDAVYYTHRLPEVFPGAKAYKHLGSGIIAAMISKDMNEIAVWFRPEQITSINWAGNPDKPVVVSDNGLLNLSPRNSFEIFSELVENTAVKWTKTEISNVMKLREKIINTISKKAGEIRILNERLKRAYEELDTFSYTISHDLRTPLTSIKSYTELVIASNKSLDEQGKKMLGRVVAGADKMNFLINEILKLARVGRAEVEFVSLDMDKIVKDSTVEVISALNAGNVEVTFGDLPAISGSPVLISQIFTNLIGNAVKYSRSEDHPAVHIEGLKVEDEIIYKIQDNGIGIEIGHHDKVFELFKRMENVKDIEGTGVGLAIVKRIIEKHNARIWFESELKVGTIFYVAFKTN